ncbi:hypothetical protein GCM10020220_105870 [Nonomuraea rubra]
MASRLSPAWRSRIRPSWTRKRSGFTAPETTASPSPGLASITLSRRLPVTGLAVNITPATRASTITWTTTASRTAAWSMPFDSR